VGTPALIPARKRPAWRPALPARKWPAGRRRLAFLSYFVRIFAFFMWRSFQEMVDLDEKLNPAAGRYSVASVYFHSCFCFDYLIIVEFLRQMNIACCLLRLVEQVHK